MKPMYIALIIVGIALIAYGTQGLIAKPSRSNNSAGAMGPEDSFPSIGHFESKDPAFNFDYPKFTNFDTEISSSTILWVPVAGSLDIPIEPGSKTMFPLKISWQEISMKVTSDYWDKLPKNGHGISYLDIPPQRVYAESGEIIHSEDYIIVFRLPKQGISIEVKMVGGANESEWGANILGIIRNSFSEEYSQIQNDAIEMSRNDAYGFLHRQHGITDGSVELIPTSVEEVRPNVWKVTWERKDAVGKNTLGGQIYVTVDVGQSKVLEVKGGQ